MLTVGGVAPGAGAAGRRPAGRPGRLARDALDGRRAVRSRCWSASLVVRARDPPARGARTPRRRLVRSAAFGTRARAPGPTAARSAVFALSFAVMMAYISASPFVYQNVVGLSEVGYGVAFGVNAVGLIAAGWVASRLVERGRRGGSCGPRSPSRSPPPARSSCSPRLGAPTWTYAGPDLRRGRLATAGSWATPPRWRWPRCGAVAGAGSAVLGFSQFALGAVVSPLVGLGGEDSAVVPALVMAAASRARVHRRAGVSLRRLVSRARPPTDDRDVVQQPAQPHHRRVASRAAGASARPR